MKRAYLLLLVFLYYNSTYAEKRFPKDGNIFTSSEITFYTDNPINDITCDSFLFQITRDPLFSTFIFNTIHLNDSITISSLPFNETLYWKVLGFRTNGIDTSDIYQFKLLDPNSIPSIKLWLNPDSNVFVNSIGQVDSIKSISNNYNFHQNDSLFKPSLIESNRYNELAFDGINDYLTSFDNLNFGNKSWVIYFIIKKKDSSKSVLIDKRGNGNIYNTAGYVVALDSSFNSSIVSDGQLTYQRLSSQNYWNSDTSLSLYKFIWDNDLGKINLWKNQNLLEISFGFGNQANSNNNSTINTTIGGGLDVLGNPNRVLKGTITEIIMIDSINNELNNDILGYIESKYIPSININSKIHINNFCDTTITVDKENINSFLWSTGDTTNYAFFSKSGIYWIERISTFGKVYKDTFEVIYPKVSLNISSDTTICLGDSIILTSLNYYSQYLWQDNSADSFFIAHTNDSYYCKVTDELGCFTFSDTLNVFVDSFSLKNILPDDTSLCKGERFSLGIDSLLVDSILWSNHSIYHTITVDTSERLSVFIRDSNQCIIQDSFNLIIKGNTPMVDYSISNTCIGDSVLFISSSSATLPDKINTTEWIINNTDTIIGQEIKKVFSISNHYEIVIKVTTDSNCISQKIDTFNIAPKPLADFLVPIICNKDSFQVFNLHQNQNQSLWIWKNDTIALDSVTFLYTDGIGIDSITLIVKNIENCISKLIKPIEVFPELKADFSTTQNCLGDSVIFTDASSSLSVVNWNWKTNGVAFSTQSTAKKVFNTLGAQNVSLEIINAIGCRSSISKNIMISPQPIANFGFDKTCAEDSSLFYDNSILSLDTLQNSTWQIDTSIYTKDSIKHFFSNNNDILVKYHITTKNACTDDTLRIVNVHEKPIANFSFNPKYGEAPLEVQFENETENTTQFQWDFGTGNDFSTKENPSFTYGENGIYNISLLATNALNCSDKKTRKIHIAPSFLDIDLSNLKLNIKEERGTLKVKPQLLIKNIGTRTIENTDLLVSLNQNAPYAKLWQGDLVAGSAVNYIFDDYIVAPSLATNQYICVEATNVNDNTETLLNNNKVCALLNGLVQISTPYPNPANDYIYIDIITESAENIAISVFNAVGKKVQNVEALALKKGYNQIEIETKKLQADKYFIVLKYLEQNYRKTFWVK